MDIEAVKRIITNVNLDYDIEDPDDIAQFIVDLLYTLDKKEFEDALLQIDMLKD